MTKLYTVDASVFLNAFNPYEEGHETSRQFLAYLQEQAVPIIVPTLLLPEVAAAIRRGRGDANLSREFVAALGRLSHLVWVSLDTALARQSADAATQYRLRGSDAIYAAVAQRFGSVLVTLDRQQRERVGEAIAAQYPIDALAEIG